MNFILYIVLSGVFPSGISDMTPDNEESDMEPITDEENIEEEIKDNTPANEKNDSYYHKDIKQYVFTTQNPNGSESEITVRVTTDLNFALRNYKLINETTTSPTGKPNEEYFEEHSEKSFQKTTQGPNEPEFWTMLAKALGEIPHGENGGEKDQLFEPIPSSDLKAINGDKQARLQDAKLKLMLGLSLMTLFLFVILLAASSALLYKLKTSHKTKYESEFSIHPELAARSYFQPSEGVSDTSFSRSAESSTFWGTSSELRQTDMSSKSQMTAMAVTISDDNTYMGDQQNLSQNEEVSTDE